MNVSDEIGKLGELHKQGVLTDEEFTRAKARLLGDIRGNGGSGTGGGYSVPPSSAPFVAGINALRRSSTDRWVAGVCGGIARSTGMESWVLRLLFVVFSFFGGFGVVAYLLLWIFVPAE